MSFVAGAGKTNVDLLYSGMPRVPQEGEEIYAKAFSLQLGGGPPATLINLGRLNVPAHIQTFLGQDLFSRFAREEFVKHGVQPENLLAETDHLEESDEVQAINLTSAVITKRDRAFISYSGRADIKEEHIHQVVRASLGARVVLMQTEFLPAYAPIKQTGATLVFDTGWTEDMHLSNMKDILSLADYYTPNEPEALRLTGESSPGKAARALSAFFKQAIVKLGADGVLLYENGRETHVKAIPDTRAVDTTGAGDAFLAGFVYGLYHHAPINQALLYGNITGAACVEGIGCLSSYVTEEELLEKARKHQGLIGASRPA